MDNKDIEEHKNETCENCVHYMKTLVIVIFWEGKVIILKNAHASTGQKEVIQVTGSLFENSIIKRISKGGYVGKERYEVHLWNGGVILVTDKSDMQELEKIIKEVKDFTDRNDMPEAYYTILTNRLIEEGW